MTHIKRMPKERDTYFRPSCYRTFQRFACTAQYGTYEDFRYMIKHSHTLENYLDEINNNAGDVPNIWFYILQNKYYMPELVTYLLNDPPSIVKDLLLQKLDGTHVKRQPEILGHLVSWVISEDISKDIMPYKDTLNQLFAYAEPLKISNDVLDALCYRQCPYLKNVVNRYIEKNKQCQHSKELMLKLAIIDRDEEKICALLEKNSELCDIKIGLNRDSLLLLIIGLHLDKAVNMIIDLKPELVHTNNKKGISPLFHALRCGCTSICDIFYAKNTPIWVILVSHIWVWI